MRYADVVTQIAEIDGGARLAAGRTLQQIMGLRNWIIGATIVEFEQAGEDRAAYVQRLMAKLADSLRDAGCQGLSARNLKNFRQVALAYPGLDAAGLARRLALPDLPIRQTSAEFGDQDRTEDSAFGDSAPGIPGDTGEPAETRQASAESPTPPRAPPTCLGPAVPLAGYGLDGQAVHDSDLLPPAGAVADRRRASAGVLRASLHEGALVSP